MPACGGYFTAKQCPRLQGSQSWSPVIQRTQTSVQRSNHGKFAEHKHGMFKHEYHRNVSTFKTIHVRIDFSVSPCLNVNPCRKQLMNKNNGSQVANYVLSLVR